MPLPMNRVDELFGRLHLRYGAKFDAAYAGLDMAFVKADWAEVLDGTSEHAIAYGIVNLPLAWPPTAGEFVEICRRAPEKKLPALKPPAPTEADKARVRSMLAGLKRKLAMGKVA